MLSYCSGLLGVGTGEEFQSIEEVRGDGDRWR
jgi:hypothetical protein